MQRFGGAIGMGDRRTKHHTTTSRFLFTTTLKYSSLLGKSVLHVDVSLFQNTNAVACDHHVLRWIHVHLDHDGAVDFSLDAGRRVLTADAASLVEHMGCDTAEVGADENLQGGWLVVAN